VRENIRWNGDIRSDKRVYVSARTCDTRKKLCPLFVRLPIGVEIDERVVFKS
jgi:hypothetical protein